MINFRKVGERLVPYEVIHVKINPSMDIVALALTSGDVLINRLYSWQRVWSISKPKFRDESIETPVIIDMVWSPDGKILAVAYNQAIEQEKKSPSLNESMIPKHCSSVVLYCIETNQKAHIHSLEYEISCLCWQVKSSRQKEDSLNVKPINIDELKLPLDSVNIPYVDLFICDDEILNYPFNTISNKNSKPDSNKYSTTGKNFTSNLPPLSKFYTLDEFASYDKMNLLQNKTINILMIGTKQNIILFYLFGYYQIMEINLKQFLNGKLIDNDFAMDRIWMSPDLDYTQIFIKHNSIKHSNLFLFETALLSNLWKEIYLINRIHLNIDIRMKFLDDSIKDICSIWSDVVIDIEARLSNYQIVQETPNPKNSNNQVKQQTQLKPQDFIDMLIFGNISLNLERFLHDLSKKGISKLYNSFEHCVNEIYRLIITRVLNILIQIMSYLDNLRGIILNDLQFGDLGLSVEDINLFRLEVFTMMDKCNKLMITLNDLKCKMLAFTRLIYKGVYMVQSQYSNLQFIARNEGENVKLIEDPTIGKMTIQDFHLVMDFLNESSFSNGFKFDMVGKMLKNLSPSSSTASTTLKNEDYNDENIKNPYKSYVEEKQLKHFIEILNKSSQKINEMNGEDLFKLFFSQLDLDYQFENIKENDPDNTSRWFKMLFNDYSNIDSIDERIYNEWSLSNHFDQLTEIKSKLMENSHKYMNDLQSKLIETSINRMNFQFMSQEQTNKIYEYLPVSLDCYNILDYEKNMNDTQSGYLYVSKFSTLNQDQSTISLLRFRQPYQSDKIDLIQFNLVSKCFAPCKCEQVKFQVEDFKFYDTNWITMIVIEKHSTNEEQHIHTEGTDSLKNQNSTKKQYLIQFQYIKMFDLFPDFILQISNEEKLSPELDSKNIDLSPNLVKIHSNYEGHTQIENDDDEHITVESLFKLRWLEMNNQQKCLSVSGNRNLACCRDKSRSRITTFEMDSIEDEEEEATPMVPDEEGSNIEVARLVEITPDGLANQNHEIFLNSKL